MLCNFPIALICAACVPASVSTFQSSSFYLASLAKSKAFNLYSTSFPSSTPPKPNPLSSSFSFLRQPDMTSPRLKTHFVVSPVGRYYYRPSKNGNTKNWFIFLEAVMNQKAIKAKQMISSLYRKMLTENEHSYNKSCTVNIHLFISVFLGGWYCFDDDSCRLRESSTFSLFSSATWPANRAFDGILSPYENTNPLYHNYHNV
ncbi:hypothetical protein FBUS_05634 [Fasciolopsis buskii]|uniref:Uncharacterized protein n=1 Tax=Fasciolopsis buskii TaxID=27845 RepID=A0A8E0S6N0_9TREM|nr:hypothetical protein FBUS_05634 [Fasciolopsis buski]